jgi:hypothetical protein
MNSNERLNFDINEDISVEISSATKDITKKNIQKGRMKGEINNTIEVELEPSIIEATFFIVKLTNKKVHVELALTSDEYNFLIRQLSKMNIQPGYLAPMNY